MRCRYCGATDHGEATCNMPPAVKARGGRTIPPKPGPARPKRNRGNERQEERIARVLASIRKPRKGKKP